MCKLVVERATRPGPCRIRKATESLHATPQPIGVNRGHAGDASTRSSSYLLLISRMRAVNARPRTSLKVPNCEESTLLFTTDGLLLLVAFSITPRRPK